MDSLQQLLTLLATPAPRSGNTERKLGFAEYAKDLLEAFGSGLSERDQEWLTRHLTGLPEYLRTEEGGVAVSVVVDAYRNSLQRRIN